MKYALVFLAGAAIGAVSSKLYFEKKYERIANDEIESVKEVFKKETLKKKNVNDSEMSKTEKAPTEDEKNIIKQANKIAQSNGYTDYSGITKESKVEKKEKEIYIIPRNDFGILEDYEAITVNYYDDGVITDDFDDVIDDSADIVGTEFVHHFVDNMVYVRNTRLKADYEILKTNSTFEES